MLAEAEAKTRAKGDAISGALDEISAKAGKSFTKAGEASFTLEKRISDTGRVIEKLTYSEKAATSSSHEFGKSLRDAGMNAFILTQSLISVNHQIAAISKGLNLKGALQEFRDQENAQIGLNAALDQQKRKTDDSINTYKQWARETEKVTTSSAEMNLMLAQQALAFGLNDKQAQRAVKNAISLAAATDRTARELIKVTIRLEAGSAEMLGEYIPTLVGIKEESARVVEAQRKLAEMHGIAEEKAKSFDGRIKGLDNSFNRFQYTVGRSISETLDPFIKIADNLIDRFTEMPRWLNKTIVTFTGVGAVLVVTTGTVVIAALAWKQLTIAIATAGYTSTVTAAKLWGLRVALVSGVAYGAYELGRALSGVNVELAKLNEATTESERLNKVWSDKFSENTTKILANVEKISDRMERKNKLAEEIENATTSLNSYKKSLEQTKKDIQALRNNTDLFEDISVDLDELSKKQEEWNKKIEVARSRVEMLQSAFDAIKPVEQDQKILDAITKLNVELEKEIYALNNTNDALRLYDIRLMGANNSMLAVSSSLIFLKKEFKSLADATLNASNILDSIKNQRLKLELDIEGATEFEQQLGRLQAFVEEKRNQSIIPGLQQAEEEMKVLGTQFQKVMEHWQNLQNNRPVTLNLNADQTVAELNRLSAAFESAKKFFEDFKGIEVLGEFKRLERELGRATQQAKDIKILERRNQLFKDGEDVTRKVMTPLEKYHEEVRKLRTLSSSGAISQETYNRAIDEATKQLEDAEKQAKKTRQELQRLDSVDFFSLEAKDRIDKYLETLREMFEQQRKLEQMKNGDRTIPTERMSVDKAFIEEKALAAMRELSKRLVELKEGWVPFKIPGFDLEKAPMPREVLPTPDFSGGRGRGAGAGPTVGINPYTNILSALSAPADNTVVQDRKEMVALLKSMDGTMKSIKDTPVSVLGVAQLNKS